MHANYRQTDRETDRLKTDRQTVRQTKDRQSDRLKTDRQSDRLKTLCDTQILSDLATQLISALLNGLDVNFKMQILTLP